MINNSRLKEIDEYVDHVKPDDYINSIINKYNLKEYKYIDTVEEFSLLKLRGTIKYVNKCYYYIIIIIFYIKIIIIIIINIIILKFIFY